MRQKGESHKFSDHGPSKDQKNLQSSNGSLNNLLGGGKNNQGKKFVDEPSEC